jgi:predicted dehydrogenase
LEVTDLRIVDSSEKQRQILQAETPVAASFATLEEGLRSGPTCVFICTPPSLHVVQSVAALEAGCHVFCEKPLAESLAQIGSLEQAIARTKRIFAVGFCMRHHAALVKAKRLVEEGRVGRLISIRCRMGEHLPTVRPDYKTMFTLKEAGAFDLAHEIDLACWYSGGTVAGVKGFCGPFSDLGFTAPDLVEMVLRFEPHCLASVHLDMFGSPRLRQTELIGTRGTIRVEYAAWESATVELYELTTAAWERFEFATQRDDMFAAEDREFLTAATVGGTISCDVNEAKKSLAIVEILSATV